MQFGDAPQREDARFLAGHALVPGLGDQTARARIHRGINGDLDEALIRANGVRNERVVMDLVEEKIAQDHRPQPRLRLDRHHPATGPDGFRGANREPAFIGSDVEKYIVGAQHRQQRAGDFRFVGFVAQELAAEIAGRIEIPVPTFDLEFIVGDAQHLFQKLRQFHRADAG